MGEKTLRIGTGVDKLIVSGVGHLALQLNPRNWHREVNVCCTSQRAHVRDERDKILGMKACFVRLRQF